MAPFCMATHSFKGLGDMRNLLDDLLPSRQVALLLQDCIAEAWQRQTQPASGFRVFGFSGVDHLVLVLVPCTINLLFLCLLSWRGA